MGTGTEKLIILRVRVGVGAEVGVVELQCVRFGQEFLGIECVVDFQKFKILA